AGPAHRDPLVRDHDRLLQEPVLELGGLVRSLGAGVIVPAGKEQYEAADQGSGHQHHADRDAAPPPELTRPDQPCPAWLLVAGRLHLGSSLPGLASIVGRMLALRGRTRRSRALARARLLCVAAATAGRGTPFAAPLAPSAARPSGDDAARPWSGRAHRGSARLRPGRGRAGPRR